jgi:beta-lactam-binding protein with PASTA domain
VRISLSSGAAQVAVPSVIGLSADAASANLVAAKLKFGGVEIVPYRDGLLANSVVGQSVPPGTQVAEGTAVKVQVSAPPPTTLPPPTDPPATVAPTP